MFCITFVPLILNYIMIFNLQSRIVSQIYYESGYQQLNFLWMERKPSLMKYRVIYLKFQDIKVQDIEKAKLLMRLNWSYGKTFRWNIDSYVLLKSKLNMILLTSVEYSTNYIIHLYVYELNHKSILDTFYFSKRLHN